MNIFDEFTWEKILTLYPPREYDIDEYFRILSPEMPEFLEKYTNLKIMQRLKGVGLLCGTDWTNIYKNRFYYSRYQHSLAVALIIWNFTKDKAQTLAGLFHDIATTVFSHASDFRKGDALTQTSTEEPTAEILRNDKELQLLLQKDNIDIEEIIDYHIYPIADNEIPRLSADRLEYMFPSGMALDGSWTMEQIRDIYNDLVILKNEDNTDELGFKTLEFAEQYCFRFCMIGHLLQLNENKVTLHLLGQIMTEGVNQGILQEEDFLTLSEKQIIDKLEDACTKNRPENQKLIKYYKTFRTMTKIEHTNEPLENHFCVNLEVKQRYINPLVKTADGIKRVYDVSEKAKKIIDDFLSYKDTPFGCAKLISE